MSALAIVEHEGGCVVISDDVAAGAGVDHWAVLQLIGNNIADFEEFGQVAFQMRPLPGGGVPGPRLRVALSRDAEVEG